MKALLPFALLLATPVWAEAVPTDSQVAHLVALIEARGCVIHDKNDAKLMKDSGLTQDEARAAVQRLISEGKAEITNDQLHLKTPACKMAAKPAVADRAALIAIIEAHGCKMTEAEARAELPAAGFTQEATVPIVDLLVSQGRAQIGDFGIILKKTGNCP